MADVTIKGFAGLRNTVSAERVNATPSRESPMVDLTLAVNIDLDDSGRAARRAGQTLRVAGAAHSVWSDGTTCLFVRDDALVRLSPGWTTTILADGITSGRPMAYLAHDGRIYHSDGDIAGVLENNAVRAWGLPLVDIQPTAVPVPGALAAGTYLYAMTWRRADGVESGTGAAAAIALDDNSGIRWTWPAPPYDDLVEAVLYVSAPNSEALRQVAVADAAAGTLTYTGGMAGALLSTQWLDEPPPAQCLALFRGRIYLAAGRFLYATSPLSYEHVDLRDFLGIDGSTIAVLGAVDAGLFIGTETGVYFLSGAAFNDTSLVQRIASPAIPGSLVSADGAVVTGRSELAGRPVVLFACRDGVLLGLPDGSLQNLTQARYALPDIAQGAAALRCDAMLTQYLLAAVP